MDIDVIIAFAEKDNTPQSEKEAGWVAQFKKFLELMLYQVLGQKPNIVLKEEFDSITASTMDNAAVLVTILSKDFIESGRCLDTVESFYKATSDTQANRVFKVMKTPLSNAEQPPRLRDLIGYDMYQLDTETGLMKEYADFFSEEAERQYW
ncbi:MAG TPA: TIR domain-containing protein, partial [Cyclobacteriaceae bacterium]|nr:TIR domain-containing protein [Cyclobacteriaceae bacterium]